MTRARSAILGFGAVVERPVVVRGPTASAGSASAPWCYLALTYDDRLSSADAARGFLDRVRQRAREPARDGRTLVE